jgi:hypothetical protein
MYETKEEVYEYILDSLGFNGMYYIVIDDKFIPNQEFLSFLNGKKKKAVKQDNDVIHRIKDVLVEVYHKEDLYLSNGEKRKKASYRFPKSNQMTTMNDLTHKAKKAILDFTFEKSEEWIERFLESIRNYYESLEYPKTLSKYFEEGVYLNYENYLEKTDSESTNWKKV